MLRDSKTAILNWKDTISMFFIANKETLTSEPRRLGSTDAVEKGLLPNEELKVIMPTIISSNPKDPNWDSKVQAFFNNLSLRIPESGQRLEVGFMYEADQPRVKEYIKDINDSLATDKKLKTDEDLRSYFEGQLNRAIEKLNKAPKNNPEEIEAAYRAYDRELIDIESNHYKLGHPIKPEDYLLWRISLLHFEVANHLAFIYKSKKIKFYLSNPEDEVKRKKVQSNLEDQALALYLEAKDDNSKVITILEMLEQDTTGSHDLLKDRLKEYARANSAKFVEAATNEHSKIIAWIFRAIKYGVLSRIPMSETLVSSEDANFVVGKNMDEAVKFFTANEDEHKSTIEQMKRRVKSYDNSK